MEPVYNENYYRHGVNHFPKSSELSNQSTNILCQNCTENQQKIVKLLQSFETSDGQSFLSDNHRKQYDLYARKLEQRYPLCATCTYRVSVQLKRCEDDAGLMERRRTASSGSDWLYKLKLADKMKWNHARRRFIKEIFFWPDFIFQLILIFKLIKKSFNKHNYLNDYFMIDIISFNDSDLKIWLPRNFDFSSIFHVLSISFFLIQFNGIAINLNRRNPLEIIPQLFLSISRTFIGNFLFRFERSPIDFNTTLTITTVGLAIIWKTGSRNALTQISLRSKLRDDSGKGNTFLSSKSDPFQQESLLKYSVTSSVKSCANSSHIFNRKMRSESEEVDKNGFASYSENHHKYHSFANIVPDGKSKSIMPWPEKPLPGRLCSPAGFNFDENQVMKTCSKSVQQFKMRPTKLGNIDDPLELEPMFNSFSLSDEPRNRRSSRIMLSNEKEKELESSLKDNSVVKDSTTKFVSINTTVFGMQQTSLIAVILALTFGLRGFVWPRVSLKFQLISLLGAIGRLIWLASILNGTFEAKFGYLALTLDLILIILR